MYSDHPRRHGEIADPCPVLVRSLTGEGMASRVPVLEKAPDLLTPSG